MRKRAFFEALADVHLPSAKDVLKLHELLVFARAYPDDEGVLATVETVLAGFELRRDLRRHRRKLANSGIAGTEIRYEFFYPTAVALARRFPGRLRVDWRAWARKRDLIPYLALLVPYSETPALDEWEREPREWIDFLRSAGERDGVFLALRFTAIDASSFVREVIYDSLSPAMILEPGPGMPTRTHAKAPVAKVVFQRAPLDASRPDLLKATGSWRVRVREVSRREASLYARMVSDAMVTRSRDLDAFSYASVDDVRLCDLDDGFTLAVLGVVPERRLLLESMQRGINDEKWRTDRLRPILVTVRIDRDRIQRVRYLPRRRSGARFLWRAGRGPSAIWREDILYRSVPARALREPRRADVGCVVVLL